MTSASEPAGTASLAVLNYEALLQKKATEIEKLLDASQTAGMFYLDLRGRETQTMFEDVPILFKTANEFFALPRESEEKLQSLVEGQERGYHPGKGSEYYEIPRDEFLSGKWALPASLQGQKERITRALSTLNNIAQTILAELCAAVQLEIPELGDDPTVPSDTAFKLYYKPPIHEVGKIIVPWHTDMGLLTLLWYDEPTTQVPVEHGNVKGDQFEGFETVTAVEGCILVNVADELAAKSAGRLHSTVHRVVAPPGPKRVKNTLAYLLRPFKV